MAHVSCRTEKRPKRKMEGYAFRRIIKHSKKTLPYMLFWTLENNSHILVRRRTHRRRSKLCTIFPLFLSTHLYEKHWARRQLMGHKLWVCIHRAVSIVFTCCGRDIINCKIVANRINHANKKETDHHKLWTIILFYS